MTEVEIGRGQVVEAFVVAPQVVVINELGQALFEQTWQVVVLEQDLVLHGAVVALDLAPGSLGARACRETKEGGLFFGKSGPEGPKTSESLSKARNHGCELDRFDRLGHVHLVARRQNFQTILSTGVCGQRNCWNLPLFV